MDCAIVLNASVACSRSILGCEINGAEERAKAAPAFIAPRFRIISLFMLAPVAPRRDACAIGPKEKKGCFFFFCENGEPRDVQNEGAWMI
jgi:hypothetical protein